MGGLVSPVLGTLADHTSLQVALLPLIAVPAMSWLMIRTMSEPTLPSFAEPALTAS